MEFRTIACLAVLPILATGVAASPPTVDATPGGDLAI